MTFTSAHLRLIFPLTLHWSERLNSVLGQERVRLKLFLRGACAFEVGVFDLRFPFF